MKYDSTWSIAQVDTLEIAERIKKISYTGAFYSSGFVTISFLITLVSEFQHRGIINSNWMGLAMMLILTGVYSYIVLGHQSMKKIMLHFIITSLYLPTMVLSLGIIYFLGDLMYSGKFLTGPRLTTYMDAVSGFNSVTFLLIALLAFFSAIVGSIISARNRVNK